MNWLEHRGRRVESTIALKPKNGQKGVNCSVFESLHIKYFYLLYNKLNPVVVLFSDGVNTLREVILIKNNKFLMTYRSWYSPFGRAGSRAKHWFWKDKVWSDDPSLKNLSQELNWPEHRGMRVNSNVTFRPKIGEIVVDCLVFEVIHTKYFWILFSN